MEKILDLQGKKMLLSSINYVAFPSTVERSRFLEQRGREEERKKETGGENEFPIEWHNEKKTEKAKITSLPLELARDICNQGGF